MQETGTSDLTDRSLGVMLDGVRTLARVYRENPDAKIEIPVEKKSLTMEQVMRSRSARSGNVAATAVSRPASWKPLCGNSSRTSAGLSLRSARVRACCSRLRISAWRASVRLC